MDHILLKSFDWYEDGEIKNGKIQFFENGRHNLEQEVIDERQDAIVVD